MSPSYEDCPRVNSYGWSNKYVQWMKDILEVCCVLETIEWRVVRMDLDKDGHTYAGERKQSNVTPRKRKYGKDAERSRHRNKLLSEKIRLHCGISIACHPSSLYEGSMTSTQ